MSQDQAGASSAGVGEADGAAKLLGLARLGKALGAQSIADDGSALAARLAEGRFYLAGIGQFKRGKSTLINALIGSPVLPVGFIPVTAVPTVIRYGAQPRARVQARDGTWSKVAVSDLQQYVSEEFNPENAKRIAGVEVFVPSALLSTGMCFVDTPGLGSVFTGNTAATHAFIPHIDAALVVMGADPPLAGEELALVEAVGKEVQHLILVLNKADRTTDDEREAATGFTLKVLEKRLQRKVGPVFEVSAAERMENRGPERDWGKVAGGARGACSRLRTSVDSAGLRPGRAASQRAIARDHCGGARGAAAAPGGIGAKNRRNAADHCRGGALDARSEVSLDGGAAAPLRLVCGAAQGVCRIHLAGSACRIS